MREAKVGTQAGTMEEAAIGLCPLACSATLPNPGVELHMWGWVHQLAIKKMLYWRSPGPVSKDFEF